MTPEALASLARQRALALTQALSSQSPPLPRHALASAIAAWINRPAARLARRIRRAFRVTR